jgi:HEAT repeat protein
LEKLLAMVRDEREPEVVRDAAAEAVMRSDDPRVYEFARETLGHKKLNWLVAHRLAQSGKPEAADLIASLLSDERWWSSASESLVKMGKVAVPAIERALAVGSKDVRTRSLWTIEKMQGKDALAVLVRAFRDADPEIRALAAKVAGESGNKEFVERLVGLLKDSEEKVQMAAATSLVMLGDDRAKAQAVAFQSTVFRRWFCWPYERYDSAPFLARFSLRPGMTKKEVAELLGYPQGTTGKADRWFYNTFWGCAITLGFANGELVDVGGDGAPWPPDFHEDVEAPDVKPQQ